MSLSGERERIVSEYEFSSQQLKDAVRRFDELADYGLSNDNQPLAMIPSYVTQVPNGSETGTYLALDLGGTNLRVCSVTLLGDGTFEMEQAKYPVSKALQVTPKQEELFGFIAEKVEDFVKTHHGEAYDHDPDNHLRLGFTFSFPVEQTAIDSGILLRWTKGFTVESAVGQDVVALLQQQLNAKSVPVHVVALVNDTVGTMMARSYGSPQTGGADMGAIFGTGTNGAYLEDIKKLKKLKAEIPGNPTHMVVNTEWGAFDDGKLTVLPDTRFDRALDAISVNPGKQLFEKRISGMFLGELLRQTLALYGASASEPFTLDTAIMSEICADTGTLENTGKIAKELGLEDTTDNRKALKDITFAIGRRAARLSAIPIAALAMSTGGLERKYNIGVDGSVVEYYPGFQEMMREALVEILGDKAHNFVIGVAKDGSGVGAALVALATHLQQQAGQDTSVN
ncbi:glucokinase [Savitreella phatthalungensis]